MDKADPSPAFDHNHHFDHNLYFNPEMESSQFLKGISLMENSLQGLLSLDPLTTSNTLFSHRNGIAHFLDSVLFTRDKINEIMVILSKEAGENPQWVAHRIEKGFGGPADGVTQNLIRAMTLCRNKITALIRDPEKSIPALKAKASPLEELGGRLLNLNESIANVLSAILRNPCHSVGDYRTLIENAISESNREILSVRFLKKEERANEMMNTKATEETGAKPIPPHKKSKGRPQTQPTTLKTKQSNPSIKMETTEALMENFEPTLPVLKLNPEFGSEYPWIDDEDLHLIKKTEKNANAYENFRRSLGPDDDEVIVAIQRGNHYRPFVIRKAVLIDPIEVLKRQKEQETKEVAAFDWDMLEKSEAKFAADPSPNTNAPVAPKAKKHKAKPKKRVK